MRRAASTFGCALGAAALAACGGGAPSVASSPGSATAAANRGATAEMTIDGEPVTFRGAIATGLGSHAIELELASHELACGHPLEQRGPREPDKHVVLTLAPVLHPDGKSQWHIISTFFDDASRLVDSGSVEVSGDTSSQLAVSLPALALQGGGEPPSALAFGGGTIHAQGCRNAAVYLFSGDDTTPPAARPQKNLAFSVAGVRQVIDSALLIRQNGDTQLVITTGQQSCSASTDTPDLSYTLHLDADGHARDAFLSGAILEHQMPQSFDAATPAPRVVMGKPAAGRIPVRLDGAYRHEGYAVKLAGSVQALVCDRN